MCLASLISEKAFSFHSPSLFEGVGQFYHRCCSVDDKQPLLQVFSPGFLFLAGGHEVEAEEKSKCDDAQNQRSQEAPHRKAGAHQKQ